MNNTLKGLFSQIKAEEDLKDRTRLFLENKTNGYTKVKIQKRTYQLYAAACVCLLFMLFGGHLLYFTPVARISIDINPSIEMGVNRFGQIIFVDDFNEDGKELSNVLDVKYKNYTDAIEQILNNDTIAALMSNNEVMTITVVGPDESQSAKILSWVEACTAKQTNTYCYFARSEEVAAAKEMGFSCGKYRAFLELQHLDPNIAPETVLGMTMREIQELIDSLSDGSENDVSPCDNCEMQNEGNGAGHGRGWGYGRTERQSNGE